MEECGSPFSEEVVDDMMMGTIGVSDSLTAKAMFEESTSDQGK